MPGTTISKDVTITVVHPEHVKAEVVEREPIGGLRGDSMSLESEIGGDEPYQALVVPEPEPVDPPAEQSPAGGLQSWFDLLGWEWPW